ncbi:MAG: alpha-hydroxy acid oxidase [Armatimonadota bacterium]|nr:alpha-hydroxy acid oxidase [Armatimonadota bacterium]MDR5696130.1 alpha-hydroxy acid oxidase [Armatimonadota bacterium]
MTVPGADRTDLDRIHSVCDLEALARDHMDSATWAYYAGGAADEVTLRDNVWAFTRYRLRPRVLVDVSRVDPQTTVLGTPVAMPVGLAPCALQGLAHPEGEVATARAAAEAGVLMCLSTLASRTIEDVAAVRPGPRWFQLYVYRDRTVAEALVRRAETAGYTAIVLTVDLPVPGYRERELREPLDLSRCKPANLPAEGDLMDTVSLHFDRSLSWGDLAWLRSLTRLPIVLKGVLTAEDAQQAVEHGVEAVWVSNHGGRQLDRAVAAIDALAEIVDAVGGRAEVYVDSGIRRGTDVVTALALGARAVFVGRPYLWGLAVAGEAGVARVLQILREELVNAMTLLGVTRPERIGLEHVRAVGIRTTTAYEQQQGPAR